jgi:hypothetical protein
MSLTCPLSYHRCHYRHRGSGAAACRCRYRLRNGSHWDPLRKRHSLLKKIYRHLDNSLRRQCLVVPLTCSQHHSPCNRRYSLARRLFGLLCLPHRFGQMLQGLLKPRSRYRRARCNASKPTPRSSSAWRSRSFATFLLSYVDGEAVEQEDDNCFGVVRCHHGLRFHAQSDNPRKA